MQFYYLDHSSSLLLWKWIFLRKQQRMRMQWRRKRLLLADSYSVADAATETDAAESSNICVRNVCSKVHNQKGMQYLHPFLHIKCYPSFVAFSFWI